MAERFAVTSTPAKAAAASFAGLAAIALAVIGLAGVFPWVMLSISIIALGVALVFRAGVVAARFAALSEETSVTTRAWEFGRWGGTSISFLAGVSGIALGFLSLVGIAPMVLMPVAVILYGSGLILDSGVSARINALEVERSTTDGLSKELARESAAAASGVQVLVGLGGITLGILALVGIGSSVLSLVAVLTVSAALLITGFMAGRRTMPVR